MRVLDEVRVLPRCLLGDSRGWLLKLMDGTEPALSPHFGEIYMVTALPGQVRANHYHLKTSEWFTVIKGSAVLKLADPKSGEHEQMRLHAKEPKTVFVPAGVAHAFKNPEDSGLELVLIAYADQPYDPEDTLALQLL